MLLAAPRFCKFARESVQLAQAERRSGALVRAAINMPDSSSSTLQRMAWVSCYDGVPCGFDAHGKRVLYTASGAWALPPQPPAHVHYGGPPGDVAHERLTREELEERLGFTLIASLVVSSPELLRSLPLLNLHPDCLPPELVVPALQQDAISAAVRAGYVSSDVFVAPDAYGGCGLFAAAELSPMVLVLSPSPDPSPEPDPRALSQN